MRTVSKTWLKAIEIGRNGTEEVDALKSNLPVFPWIHHPLHPKLMELTLRLGVHKSLEPDEPIFGFHQKVDKFVIVTKGVTGRSVGDPNAQNSQAIAISPPGHIAAGNLNLFSGRPAIGRYFALTHAEIVLCPREIFLSVVRTDPELLDILLLQLELCSLSDRFGFACLSLLDAEERLKVWAISWGAFFGRRVIEPETQLSWIKMPHPMSRKIRARITRTSTIWIDKILKEWKEKGVWRRTRDWVYVRPDLLESAYSWLRLTEDKSNYSYPSTLEDLIKP